MLRADNEVAGLCGGEQAGAVCKTRTAYSAAPALPRKCCYQVWEGAIGMSSEHGQWLSGGWVCLGVLREEWGITPGPHPLWEGTRDTGIPDVIVLIPRIPQIKMEHFLTLLLPLVIFNVCAHVCACI